MKFQLHRLQEPRGRWVANEEFERTWKQRVAFCFKILLRTFVRWRSKTPKVSTRKVDLRDLQSKEGNVTNSTAPFLNQRGDHDLTLQRTRNWRSNINSGSRILQLKNPLT
jgi:hypothetical protein